MSIHRRGWWCSADPDRLVAGLVGDAGTRICDHQRHEEEKETVRNNRLRGNWVVADTCSYSAHLGLVVVDFAAAVADPASGATAAAAAADRCCC